MADLIAVACVLNLITQEPPSICASSFYCSHNSSCPVMDASTEVSSHSEGLPRSRKRKTTAYLSWISFRDISVGFWASNIHSDSTIYLAFVALSVEATYRGFVSIKEPNLSKYLSHPAMAKHVLCNSSIVFKHPPFCDLISSSLRTAVAQRGSVRYPVACIRTTRALV